MAAAAAYGLTALQRDALLVIQELTALDGVAPSFDEIRHELCLTSKSQVVKIIDRLLERGYVGRLPRKSRSLVVLKPISFPDEPEIVGLFEVA